MISTSIKNVINVFQAPYLEIKKQMDKQDPLAHPLLQWYKIDSHDMIIIDLPR